MWESANTTAATNTGGLNSQLSFYEYPPHKPFINSTYQPLRPSHTLSRTVALPESNRDQLLTALQSLSLRIKTLENDRERAESNLREITGNIPRPRTHREDPQGNINEQFKEAEKNFHHLEDQHGKVLQMLNDHRPRKNRSGQKKKRVSSSQHNHSFETATTGTTTNSDGRHYHLDMNTVPFILGASTSPSHNVNSNVQNVIALLKSHNHQLCLSSKEHAELLHQHIKGDLSPHTLLYLDHYNKSSIRPSSASPVRSIRRPITASSTRPYSASRRPHSVSRRPQSATISDKQCYSRIKHLRQEFAILAREHTRQNTSRINTRELEIINRRMEIILDELERLQRQLRISLRKSSLRDQFEQDKNETPLETLRKTRLLQILLKDSTNKQQQQQQQQPQHRGRSHRRRPYSND